MKRVLFDINVVLDVHGAVVEEALQLPLPDFEGAATVAAARVAACECIVTRDPKGFRGSPVRCLTPEALTPLLPQQGVDAP
jgi:hypothetical protein